MLVNLCLTWKDFEASVHRSETIGLPLSLVIAGPPAGELGENLSVVHMVS